MRGLLGAGGVCGRGRGGRALLSGVWPGRCSTSSPVALAPSASSSPAPLPSGITSPSPSHRVTLKSWISQPVDWIVNHRCGGLRPG